MIGELTSRDVDIARELLKGKSDKEICESLGISLNTVKVHMYNISISLGHPSGGTRGKRIFIATHLMKAAREYPLVAEALEVYFDRQTPAIN